MGHDVSQDGTPKSITELVKQLEKIKDTELDQETLYWRIREFTANQFAVLYARAEATQMPVLDSLWAMFKERDVAFLNTTQYLISVRNPLAECKIKKQFYTILVQFTLGREMTPEELRILSDVETMLFNGKYIHPCERPEV